MVLIKKNITSKLALGLLASAAFATTATPAYAQLDEIIVTARKKAESLQDTPVAVTALTAEELETRGALTISEATAGAPNVIFESAGTTSGLSAAPTVFIRGLGQSDFVINADQAVGTYVDGVFLGRSIGSLTDLLDLDRVEVLRGPQGTLFGRNTIGGAVNLVSKAPSTDGNSGKASFAVGENGYVQGSATGNIALSDNVAARVSGFFKQRDGFVDALQYDDFQLGEENAYGFRGAIRFTPTDTLTIDLTGDYSERNEAPAAVVALQLGNVSENGNNVDASGSPASARFNQGGPPFPPPLPAGFISTNPEVCSTAVGRATNTDCFGNVFLGNGFESNALFTDGDGNIIEPENELEVYGGSLTVALETAIGELKSISALRGFRSQFTNDFDFSPFIIFHNVNNPFNHDQFSQEFQLTNTDAFDGKLDYVLGLYYFEEDGLQNIDLVAPTLPPANNQTTLPLFQSTARNVDNSSVAAFAQATYHVTDRLDVTGGIRYTEEEKDIFFDQTRSVGAVSTQAEGSLDISEVDYLANISYDVTDDTLAYATFSTGFRSGGFASRFPAGLVSPLPTFDPEFVKSYELGLKTQFFDNRVRANIAAFLTDYQDLQVTAGSPALGGAVLTQNLADATLKGVEIEVDISVTDNLTLDLSGGFLDDSIDSIVGGELTAGGGAQTFTITEDSELPYTPDINFNVGATHFAEVGPGELRTRFDWFYTSAQELRIENLPITRQEGYHRINANTTYTPDDSFYSLTLGVRNLTDENYSTAAAIATDAASISANVARPREVYGQVIVRFGE